MLRRVMPCSFQQFKSADEITAHIAARILNRVTHASLRCKMQNSIELVGFKEGSYDVFVFYACVRKLESAVVL